MIGFQIATRTRKVDAASVEKFRSLPVANISDSMSRMTAGGNDVDIRRLCLPTCVKTSDAKGASRR